MRKNYLRFGLFTAFVLFTSFMASAQSPDMVKVEGGTFKMGSKDANNAAESDEQKEHSVTLSTFEISKFEVTVFEWKLYIKENKLKMPKAPKWGWNDNYPVTNITWVQAVEYCNWLSRKNKLTPAYSIKNTQYVCDFTSNGFRLPTEAEWEFSAKGGNFSKNFEYAGHSKPEVVSWNVLNSNKRPHLVGTKLPNELGIYDMSGNVWEWCWDWYNGDFYTLGKDNNPTGTERGEERCVRGGSWDSKLGYLRTANRLSSNPEHTNEFFGFRIARSVTAK